jgi:hypothetical protein
VFVVATTTLQGRPDISGAGLFFDPTSSREPRHPDAEGRVHAPGTVGSIEVISNPELGSDSRQECRARGSGVGPASGVDSQCTQASEPLPFGIGCLPWFHLRTGRYGPTPFTDSLTFPEWSGD